MSYTFKLLDKLPPWAKVIFAVFSAFAGVYYVIHYGLKSFMLAF